MKLDWCQARWKLTDARVEGGSSLGGLIKVNICSPFNEYQQCGLCHPDTVQALESPRKRYGSCFWESQCWEKLSQLVFTT